jgi:hypothetical protein
VELAIGVSTVNAVVVEDSYGSGYVQAPDYVSGEVYVRNNKIRYVDGTAPSGTNELAMLVTGARSVMVSSNVVESANAMPLQNERCGDVSYSNNRSPAGVLIEGYNRSDGRRYPELETENEFALALSMFRHRR